MRRIAHIAAVLQHQVQGVLPDLVLPVRPSELDPPPLPRWRPPRVPMPAAFIDLDAGRLSIAQAIDLAERAPNLIPPAFAVRYDYAARRFQARFRAFEQRRVTQIEAYAALLKHGNLCDPDVDRIIARICAIEPCPASRSESCHRSRHRAAPQRRLRYVGAPTRVPLHELRERWADALRAYGNEAYARSRYLSISEADDLVGAVDVLRPGVVAAQLLATRFRATYDNAGIGELPATAAQLVAVIRVYVTLCAERWFPFSAHGELLPWHDATHQPGHYDLATLLAPCDSEHTARVLLAEYGGMLLEGDLIPLGHDADLCETIAAEGSYLGLVLCWHLAVTTDGASESVDLGALFDGLDRNRQAGHFAPSTVAALARIPMTPQLPHRTPMTALIERLRGREAWGIDLGAVLTYALGRATTWFLAVSEHDIYDGAADPTVDLTDPVAWLDEIAAEWRTSDALWQAFADFNARVYAEPSFIDRVAQHLVAEASALLADIDAVQESDHAPTTNSIT